MFSKLGHLHQHLLSPLLDLLPPALVPEPPSPRPPGHTRPTRPSFTSCKPPLPHQCTTISLYFMILKVVVLSTTCAGQPDSNVVILRDTLLLSFKGLNYRFCFQRLRIYFLSSKQMKVVFHHLSSIYILFESDIYST